MAFTEQDLVKGIDFTALTSISATSLNQLVSNCYPVSDSANEGKGLVLWSKDSAADTPIVPNPVTYAKWARYVWIRAGFNATYATKVYVWDANNANAVPALLNWLELTVDLTAIQADIDAVEIIANAAKVSADNAVAIANSSASLATTANTTANDLADDVAAATAASTAASTKADTANTNATTAINQSNAAIATANAQKSPAIILTPGATGQMLRTNQGATAVEYFTPSAQYFKFDDTETKGSDNGVASGADTIIFNTNTNVNTDLVTLDQATGKITCIKAGKYHIKAIIPFCNMSAQAFLIKDADGSVLLAGTSCKMNPGLSVVYETGQSIIEGLLTMAVGDIIKVVLYNTTNVNTYGLGAAVNICPAGQKEYYGSIQGWFIGA